MKKLLSLLSIFAIVLSCSSDETSTPVTPPIVKYTITLSAGQGGTVSTTGGEYEKGQTVTVTATPQGEYVFKDWSDGNTDATRTITVSTSITLTANFEKKKYPLTVNIEGEGEVLEEIVNAGRTTDYNSGTTVKLTAVPSEGWEFTGWKGAINGTSNPQQLLISEPKTVLATFNFPEIESNLFKESYSYYSENYSVGDIIDIDGVSFEIKNFSKFDDEGWINFMSSQYGISVALNHIKLSPMDCYNSDLIAELFFNSENGDFLMVRFGNLNFAGDVFHFLKKRFYREDFNPPFNDNSQAKHFDNTDFLFYNVGKYIENLKTHEFSIYDITFKVSEGGFFELKNLKTSEVNIIKNDTTYLNITDCQKFSVKAIPYDNFHFNGWSEPILDTVQMIPSINLNISNSLLVESKFISKISTNKSIISEHNCLSGDNPTVTDDMLDFRASENFIVWWDKEWFHNNDAKEIIHWAEFTYSKAIEYGMRSYIESALTNIYIHHVSNESGNDDVFSDGWGQGAANCEVASIVTHPYSTGNSIKMNSEFNDANLSKIRINPLFPKYNVHHEVFHVMQQYASMNNTFPYSGDFGWYTEATAEWFEVKYRPSPDVWRHAPYYLLNPNLRLWDFTWDDDIFNKHRYGASLFLFYLEWNNIVEESFFGQSYYSGTKLTPQEYLKSNIPNFKNHFIDFAGKASVIDFQYSVQEIKQQKLVYLAKTKGIDTQFELVLNNQGTNGTFTPSRKIEGWAYQTLKLNSTSESKYTFKFNSNLIGSEGGLANFNIVITKEKAGEYSYEKKYIENDSIIFEFTADAETIYYFTIVNTPEKLKGNDQYEYNIELVKL
jgi:hypothetical protein